MYTEQTDAVTLKHLILDDPSFAALVTANAFDDIADILNDRAAQKSVDVTSVTMSEMVGAIMSSDDYAAHGAAIGAAITPMVLSGQSFRFDEPNSVAGMEAALAPYAGGANGALDKFQALRTTKGSRAEALFGQNTNLTGAQIHNALNVPG